MTIIFNRLYGHIRYIFIDNVLKVNNLFMNKNNQNICLTSSNT